jgi:hypothetical protein
VPLDAEDQARLDEQLAELKKAPPAG